MIFLIHLVLCAGENRWDEGRLLCHRSQSGFTVQNSFIGIGMRSSITLKCSSAARQLEFNRFFKVSLGMFWNVFPILLCPDLGENSTLTLQRKGWSLPMRWLWSVRRWDGEMVKRWGGGKVMGKMVRWWDRFLYFLLHPCPSPSPSLCPSLLSVPRFDHNVVAESGSERATNKRRWAVDTVY